MTNSTGHGDCQKTVQTDLIMFLTFCFGGIIKGIFDIHKIFKKIVVMLTLEDSFALRFELLISYINEGQIGILTI